MAENTSVNASAAATPAGNPINLAIIGGGPGGYAAAFLANDLGMKVTLIDLEKNPGGVCLYRGCIPSKALLHVAAVINEAQHSSTWGVEFAAPKIDVSKLRAFKEGVVNKLTGGLGMISKQRKITYIQGRASFVDAKTLRVEKLGGGEETLSFDRILIATVGAPAFTAPHRKFARWTYQGTHWNSRRAEVVGAGGTAKRETYACSQPA